MKVLRLGLMFALALVTILLLLSTPGVLSTPPRGSAGAAGVGTAASHAASTASMAHGGHANPAKAVGHPTLSRPPVGLWNSSSGCQAKAREWNLTYGDISPPLDVRRSLQSPCYIGHDEPGLSFVSNQSYSGSRVQFVIQLPSNRTTPSSAFTTIWVGMWMAGVPCSYRGLSYLEVQINPPYNDIGLTPNPNWTVQAPIWDVVQPGSCDPQCTNDSATLTVGGASYCEDDAVLSGVGTYTPSGWGNFAPNDRLVVQMVGQVGSTSGLSVYINDTTSASRSINWSYGAAISATGIALTPAYNTSGLLDQGWSYGLNVEATWENCPHAPGPTTCNSYNGAAVNAVDVPTFESATFWNASTRSYTTPYAWTETTSSTGACSGKMPYVAPCYDYQSFGGSGFYPYWSLHASSGKAWWSFGGKYPNEVSNFGGIQGQFAPYGLPASFIDPTSIYGLQNVTGAANVTVTASVADPNGVAQVTIGDYWCNSGGVPTVGSFTATLGGGPQNTSQSGAWSAMLPRNGAFHGTVHFWVTGQSTSGVWTSPAYGRATFAGGAGCIFSAPSTPWFGRPNITAVTGGYQLAWTENSTAIQNYTVWLNATVNGTPFAVAVGASPSTIVSVPDPSVAYRVSIVATNFADLNSPRTGWVLAPLPVPYMSATLSGQSSTTFWVHQADTTFSASVAGGIAPFTYLFYFSDGTNTTLLTANRSITLAHNFGNYFGTAQVYFLVGDASGAVTESNPVPITILATPLGVPQTVSAGDGWVMVNWSAPLSPAGPATRYTVYYTTDATWAFYLTAFWPNNYTAPYNVSEWNTTATSLLLRVDNGLTLYAQVTAWNLYGQGQLPSGAPPPVLVARPAPLTVSPITSLPGGAAPFTDSLSAYVTGGTNLIVSSAIYSFSGGGSVIPTINSTTNGTWVNASYTFTSPGLKTIVLHVTDALFDTAIVTTTVWVGAGTGPAVSISSTGSVGWVGSAMGFGAVASAGSGNYSYQWTFGDGAAASGASPSHTYLSTGTFGVSVWVTDLVTMGVSVRNLAVTIYALPTIAISTSAGPNGSLSYTFTALTSGGSGPPSIVWAFGDGSIGHGSPISHDFSAAGSYTVNVISTDLSNRAAYANVTLSAATPGGGGTSVSFLSGSGAALLVILAVLAFVFFLGMLYFWGRGRGTTRVMAPEPTGNEIVVREP